MGKFVQNNWRLITKLFQKMCKDHLGIRFKQKREMTEINLLKENMKRDK